MRAFRHSKLLKACTAANRFALLTSAYIWPGGHIYCSASAIASKLALLSASTYIRLRFACRIYCSASAIASQVNLHYSRLLRIFGCTLLAAYTVAPRQSKWNALSNSIWRYMRASRHSYRHSKPQFPLFQVFSYLSLRFISPNR